MSKTRTRNLPGRLKQVTLTIPISVIEAANRRSKAVKVRPDGLKNLPTRILRDWVVKGYQNEVAEQCQTDPLSVT